MEALTLRLLGPFILERGSTQVELKRAKSRALLAYLACNPQRHTRLHLVSLLWPEVDEARGLATLRTMLWELQRLLGDGVLEADRTSLQFHSSPELWVDVWHFQHLLREAAVAGRTPAGEVVAPLSQAVALYRGRLLEELSLADCASFGEWQSLATEHHHLLATQALQQLASTLISQGRLEAALPHAQQLVALEPTHEENHRLLIQLYAWLERWADALRQHRQCLDILRTELDVPPQPQTLRLLQQLQARNVPAPQIRASPPAPELARPEHVPSLPTPDSALHGRANELRLILKRLEDPACQMLTLTGPGGVGKTTLALEAARLHAPTLRHGVCFVPLAAVDDAARVPVALLEALTLPASQAPPLAQLREHLRSRDMLLVLDNFEHLLDAAPVLAELLAHAPSLKLIVTSRERLNLRREWLLTLEGLPHPQGPGLEGPREALELFALLASRAEASFQLTADNEAAVARLCQLVEGNPLGLELAAAWVPFFPPAELAARLERDLGMLAAPRDAPERHQSLHATFLHSWRLLSAEEQGVLRRMSVFRGGATLEATVAVTGATLASLTSLTHKSLLRRTASGRLALQGLLRQYAEQELRAVAAEHERTHHQHAEHFLGALGQLLPRLEGSGQAQALAALEPEHEELRAAFRWACGHGRWELLAHALEAYGLAQELRGRFQETSALLAEAVAALRPVAAGGSAGAPRRLLGRLLAWQARLALGGATLSPAATLALVEEMLMLLGEQGAKEELTSALLTAGRLALKQGRVPGARWSFHGSLSLARANGNRRATALAMSELAEVAAHQGRPAQLQRLLANSLATFRLLGDERHVATCLSRMASLLLARGELDKAASALREGLELLERSGLPLQAAPLRAQLAEVWLQRGALEQARQLFEGDLRLGRALGHPETVAQALHGLGLVSSREGQPLPARRLLEEALALRNQIGARRAAAESLQALGRLALAEGELSLARGYLHSALQAALEVNSPSLLLDLLVTLAELPLLPGEDSRLHRALCAIVAHPLTSHASRQRAATRFSLPLAVGASSRRPLPQLVADVLASVGMT